jgi:hypothetical protein
MSLTGKLLQKRKKEEEGEGKHQQTKINKQI